MRAVLCGLLLCAGGCLSVAAQDRAGRDADAAKLTLGKPLQSGRIAVVPILSSTPLGKGKYITLAEAIKRHAVEVIEIPGRAEVNSLEVRNRAELPLLLVAGELLLGGKQDRIVAKDVIIPPRESRQVPVFCVEHGRWDSGRTSFQPASTLVPDHVRSAANETQSQSEVWRKVASGNARVGATSSTGTVQALLNTPKVAAAIEETSARLGKAFTGEVRAVGVMCWLDGKIHSADLFASPALFAANRDKLIRSYCADMLLSSDAVTAPVDMKACADFLAAIRSSARSLAGRDRDNANFSIRDGRVQGYESGGETFGGGFGGGGFGHGTYKPGGKK